MTMQWTIDVEAAADYHARHKPQALFVTCKGETLFERYDGDLNAEKAHALYSGTKSFWGIAAVAAAREGIIALDEPVAETIESWRTDPRKRLVTLRHLLQLTAGIGFGGLGAAVPPYAKALAVDLRAEPGSKFTYGGIPLQVFGAVFARKLEPLQVTPHEYLRMRIFGPAGVAMASWRQLPDGTHPLPTGAFLTAHNWHAFGAYVARRAAENAECFRGSAANPRYGLAWWLAPPSAPDDLVYASGSGGQALYIVPSLGIVAARFAQGGSFKHEAFLKRLFPC